MAGLVRAGADHQAHESCYLTNLALAAQKAAAHGIEIMIEPINARDMPGYFLNRLDQARRLIERSGQPQCETAIRFLPYADHTWRPGHAFSRISGCCRPTSRLLEYPSGTSLIPARSLMTIYSRCWTIAAIRDMSAVSTGHALIQFQGWVGLRHINNAQKLVGVE